MGRTFLLLGLVFGLNYTSAQVTYPENYFINPLEIPLILSGSFGELRSNHFHSGLDIKTQKREGLNVLASADGYVSRIKISHWGFGKALYITHPNGYTTVYAHLKKFSPKIEAYVKKLQYQKEKFTLEVFPKPHELIIDKAEIIAFSGNTGGSGGPHLHYEIRDANSKPINPLLFGLEIPDSRSPEIRAGLVYSFGDSAHVDRSKMVKTLNFKPDTDGNLLADQIEAYGVIGLGISVIDKQDGALNNNGVYSLTMSVNDRNMFEHKVDTYSFAETRYINAHIDYQRYSTRKQRIQKCFVEAGNKLSTYRNLVNNGFINIENGRSYNVRITARDLKGNSRTLIIPIKGTKASILVLDKQEKTPHYFKANVFNKISQDNITVAFPKGSFYKDLYFDLEYKNEVLRLHNKSVPVHKNFTLTFDISQYPKEKREKMFIARKNANGRLYYTSTRRKDNKLYTLSKTLGNYTLALDTIKPKIRPVNFKDKQWLRKYRYLKIRLSDNLSGIKRYRGEIDGQWIRLEFDAKKSLLTYDFNDLELKGERHELKITAVDNVNNTNVYIASFNRKD